jgi:hypothetical protein
MTTRQPAGTRGYLTHSGSALSRCSPWEQSVVDYEALLGIAWAWLALDGAMTIAPLGEKGWPDSHGPRPTRHQTPRLTDSRGVPIGLAVDGAHRYAFQLTRKTRESMAVERPAPPQTLPRGGVGTKSMMTRGESCWRSAGLRLPAEREARRPMP